MTFKAKTLAAGFLAAAMAVLPASDAFANGRNNNNRGNDAAVGVIIGMGLGIILNEALNNNRGHNNPPQVHRHPRNNNQGRDIHRELAACHTAQSNLNRVTERAYRDGRIDFNEHQRIERAQYNVYNACRGLGYR